MALMFEGSAATGSARPTLLPDSLVQSLVAVGQVDVLVGVPTLDNAETIEGVVQAVVASFSGPLSRRRSLVLDADGGSTDGTPEVVLGAQTRAQHPVVASVGLRTIHRLSAPYHGVPGRGNGVRLIFAAADLLGDKAVVVLDPHARTLTKEAVAAFARAVLDDRLDFVKPALERSPWERPLVTQLIAPMMTAASGRRLRDPTATQFACSGRFAAEALESAYWDSAHAREGIDVWLTARAVLSSQRVGELLAPGVSEAVPGPRLRAGDAFQQVTAALFEYLTSEDTWILPASRPPIVELGRHSILTSARPEFDVRAFGAMFEHSARDLEPVLRPALGDALFDSVANGAIHGLALDDELWATIAWAALGAARRRVLPSNQIVGALFPLYLGRVATFLSATAAMTPNETLASLDRLTDAFARARTLAGLEANHG